MSFIVVLFFAVCMNSDCSILLKKEEDNKSLSVIKIFLFVEMIIWYLAFLISGEKLTFNFYLGALVAVVATGLIEKYTDLEIEKRLWSSKGYYFLFISSPLSILLLMYVQYVFS